MTNSDLLLVLTGENGEVASVNAKANAWGGLVFEHGNQAPQSWMKFRYDLYKGNSRDPANLLRRGSVDRTAGTEIPQNVELVKIDLPGSVSHIEFTYTANGQTYVIEATRPDVTQIAQFSYKSPATRPVEAGWYWDSKGLVWDTRAVLQPTRDIHVTYELKL
ncbi:hypothetical protein, partial [Parachitinimonas caeni]